MAANKNLFENYNERFSPLGNKAVSEQKAELIDITLKRTQEQFRQALQRNDDNIADFAKRLADDVIAYVRSLQQENPAYWQTIEHAKDVLGEIMKGVAQAAKARDEVAYILNHYKELDELENERLLQSFRAAGIDLAKDKKDIAAGKVKAGI